jgi:hypothetical protein
MSVEIKEDHPPYVSAWVGDGYDRVALIADEEGRWSPFSIRYRPMSTEEELAIGAKSRMAPHEPVDSFYAPALAGKLLGWDLKDNQGQKVPITPAAITGLVWAAYLEIKQVVCGDKKAVAPDGTDIPTRADARKN